MFCRRPYYDPLREIMRQKLIKKLEKKIAKAKAEGKYAKMAMLTAELMIIKKDDIIVY